MKIFGAYSGVVWWGVSLLVVGVLWEAGLAGWVPERNSTASSRLRVTTVPWEEGQVTLRHTPSARHWELPPTFQPGSPIELRAELEADEPLVCQGRVVPPGIYRIQLIRDTDQVVHYVLEAKRRAQPAIRWPAETGEFDRPVEGVELILSAMSSVDGPQGRLQLRWRAWIAEASFRAAPLQVQELDGWRLSTWEPGARPSVPKPGQDQPIGWLEPPEGRRYLALLRHRGDGWRLDLLPAYETILRRQETDLKRQIAEASEEDRGRRKLELRALRHRLAQVLATAQHLRSSGSESHTGDLPVGGVALRTRGASSPSFVYRSGERQIAFQLPANLEPSGPRASSAGEDR